MRWRRSPSTQSCALSLCPYADVAEDEENARTYTLQRISRELQGDLDAYRDYRLKKLNRFRKGAAVQVCIRAARGLLYVLHAPSLTWTGWCAAGYDLRQRFEMGSSVPRLGLADA